jgi:hypothetical protein
MAHERILWRGLCLLAGVLVGAPVLLSSFAADARSHHYHGAHSGHFARTGVHAPVVDGAPNTLRGVMAGKGAKQQTAGAKQTGSDVPVKETNVPDLHARHFGPIDTRITVQPHLHGVAASAIRQPKSKIGPVGSRSFHVRHAFTPGKSGHVTRNAIGLARMPRSVLPARNTALVRSPTDAALGIAPRGGGTGKPNPSAGPFAVSRPNSRVTGPAVGSEAINGNGFLRHGFVPATLGGPTKNVVVGIDGSTIRPKR